MKSFKFQYHRKPTKLNVTQTRFIKEYPSSNVHRCLTDPKENQFYARKPRTKKPSQKKLLEHKETQTREHTIFINMMQTQALLKPQVIPKKRMPNMLDHCYLKNDNDYQRHIIQKSNQFSSRQDLTGAFRSFGLCKRNMPKNRKNKDIFIVEKSRKYPDFIPQPSAFVHVLSAFISSNFEANFNSDFGSLVSPKGFTKMLEDVPEESESVYENSFAKPAITFTPKVEVNSISTYISGVEFSSDKSTITMPIEIDKVQVEVSPECLGQNVGQGKETSVKNFNLFNCNETRDNVDITVVDENEKDTSKSNYERTPNNNIMVEEILVKSFNSISSFGENSHSKIHIQKENHEISSSDFVSQEPIQQTQEYSIDIAQDTNFKKTILIPRIESIFESNFIPDYSRERFSISCPCFTSEGENLQKLDSFTLCFPGYNDNIQDVISTSENFEPKNANEDKDSETIEKNIESLSTNTSELYWKMQEKINLTKKSWFLRNKNKINKAENISKWINDDISEGISSSLSLCYSNTVNEDNIITKKIDRDETKSIMTLFSRRTKTKLLETIRKMVRMKLEKTFGSGEKDNMEDFRMEVLNFFGKVNEEKKATCFESHENVKNEISSSDQKSFEDLTLPSVKLVMPRFSQIKMDIGKTTKDKIRYLLENSNNELLISLD